MKKIIKNIIYIIVIVQMGIILVSCKKNSLVENKMNKKFIELYSEINKAHRIFTYNYDLLTEEMFKSYACVSGIDIDFKGNIWCYRELAPGHHYIDIYSIDGNVYSYLRTWGRYAGGDSNYYPGDEIEYIDGRLADGCYEDYTKYVNGVEVYEKQQNIDKEGKEIFDIYYINSIFDKERSMGLKLKCINPVSVYDESIAIDDYDTLRFGKYNEKNGFYSEPQPIEWCVLYKDENKALLLSKIILLRNEVDASHEDISFKESLLNKLLNNEFFESVFSKSEKELVLNENEYGKIFLLSEKEISKYFDNKQGKMKTYAMPYSKTVKDVDGNKKPMVEKLYDYWLRNNDVSDKCKFINENGEICSAKNFEIKGVRPAMWVKYK